MDITRPSPLHKLYAVYYYHEYGSTQWAVWATSLPSIEQIIESFDLDFDGDSEFLDIAEIEDIIVLNKPYEKLLVGSECAICGDSPPQDTDQMIDEGWVPCFLINGEERGPACPICVQRYLQYDIATSEWEYYRQDDDMNN